MLALTHHLIVQLAARMAGKVHYLAPSLSSWYTNYELLGDDIVIFDEEVSSLYCSIMSDLGVEINLSKSVIARRPVFEFAKVTGYYGRDVSALSWKAFMSQRSFLGLLSICYSLIHREMRISNWVV